MIRACLHGGDGRVHVGEGGHQDDFHRVAACLNALQKLQTAYAWHHHVYEGHVGGGALEISESGLTVLGHPDFHPARLENAPKASAKSGFVVDDQNVQRAPILREGRRSSTDREHRLGRSRSGHFAPERKPRGHTLATSRILRVSEACGRSPRWARSTRATAS